LRRVKGLPYVGQGFIPCFEGLGQGCSGYKENLVNPVNPVGEVPPQAANFNKYWKIEN
jgi:hypothetical protein